MPDAASPRDSVSVAAAIFDGSGQNVLLIKRRDNGQWEPPGGVLELAETIEDGLRREVREETGADIAVGSLTGVYKNLTAGVVALVFRCRITSPFFGASPEASSVEWVPLPQLRALTVDIFAQRIEDAWNERAAVRAHNGQTFVSDA